LMGPPATGVGFSSKKVFLLPSLVYIYCWIFFLVIENDFFLHVYPLK
jgi:hypothetical protein